MYSYVLFVMTGHEHKMVAEISHIWKIDGLNPFVPMYDAHFRKAGKVFKEKRRSIPGYIFMESPMRGQEFYLSIRPFITRSQYSLKLLRNGTGYLDQNFEMDVNDYEFLRNLLNKDRCIGMSQGFIEGTNVIIIDGPLVGLEGMIKRINRHKMEATIETSFMGSVRELTVGLEVVNKIL